MVLEIEGVKSFYGKVQALHGISLSIREGELVALIGPNGAGKTTLLKTISGLVRSTGKISFLGEDIRGQPAHDITEKGIAQSPEGRCLFSDMSVEDNLQLGAFRRTDRAEILTDLERVFSLFPILEERRSQVAGTMSGGEQQMLAIGRALMTKPEILLLDEPSFGIAPIMVERIFTAIKKLNREGLTTFFSEQNIHVALNNSDRTYVLEYGEIVMTDKSEALKGDPRIAESYLGL